MQRLIRDLLAYSRLGQQELEDVPVDLAALVARVQQALQLSVEEAGARIECGELPIVRGDTAQLYQLLQNLISNSIKFCDGKSTTRVKIGLRKQEPDNVFFVQDNGEGIDPAYHEKVFGLFERIDPKVEGTGIGLTVSKQLVELMGGELTLDSRPGEGSTFWIELNCVESEPLTANG